MLSSRSGTGDREEGAFARGILILPAWPLGSAASRGLAGNNYTRTQSMSQAVPLIGALLALGLV